MGRARADCVVCERPLPALAVQHKNKFCSSYCCKKKHNVKFDHDEEDGRLSWKPPTVALTRLQLERQAAAEKRRKTLVSHHLLGQPGKPRKRRETTRTKATLNQSAVSTNSVDDIVVKKLCKCGCGRKANHGNFRQGHQNRWASQQKRLAAESAAA